MVTVIKESGQLQFKPVGGIDPRVLVSKVVKVGEQLIPGVIGSKAIHLQKREERKKPYTLEQLYLDIGAGGKEEALELVKPVDYASFDTALVPLGDGYVRGKAFDDRAGCAVLVELLLMESELSFDAAFTVQEEVGSRGAAVAAYSLQPELALVIEGTMASDTPGTAPDFTITRLGHGPALSFMDRSFIADRRLWQQLITVAEERGPATSTGDLPEVVRCRSGRPLPGGVKTAVVASLPLYSYSP